MKRLVIFTILLCPSLLFAAEETGGFSMLGSFLQMLASLAIVLGLIFLFYYLAGKWFKMSPAGQGSSRYIRVVETRFLAPKKSLMLVEVSGEYLLLSSSGDQMQLVKQIDMVEEIEVVEERKNMADVSAMIRNRFSDLKEGVPGWPRLAPLLKKRGEAL
jgi:flagellar protein FliO/FliZ